MKQVVFLLSLMLGVAVATAQPLQEPLVGPTVTISEDNVYNVADEMPQFPGGQAELSKYLIKNIRYPDMALECDC
ncbi:MAG: hypothetical protein M0D57_22365 [Sphingobacteriales bacterium JAD_PAG50586_3]|nr:MAG: hypothetical protein M0D57_22365 [Sphingobacteriales bacterium JAD_PAG50586_3]